MKTDEKEVVEGKTAKYRVVEVEDQDGTLHQVEMNPENCNLLYNDPRPAVQRRLALRYESAPPASQRMLEKEGYGYRPSTSFPTDRWSTYTAKVIGAKSLVVIERNPANMAREFDCSETSIRRMIEKSEKRELMRR
ncbi:MAG: hypothetical protein ABIE25_02085 [Thermoplasmatota archaeon]